MRCGAMLFCSIGLPLALMASAAESQDPTRPPNFIATPAAVGASAAPAASTPAPRLQSLQVPRQGAASALVDGRLVWAGDKVGTALVLAIDASGLQLREANGHVHRWSLLEGLEK